MMDEKTNKLLSMIETAVVDKPNESFLMVATPSDDGSGEIGMAIMGDTTVGLSAIADMLVRLIEDGIDREELILGLIGAINKGVEE